MRQVKARMKLAKKVKKRYKISNFLLITVKADDVVGGKHTLENRQRKFQKKSEAGEATDLATSES